jgi:serine/threonine protein kinase
VTEPLVLGRYLICDEIGGGGMARVHLGRVLGAAGFSRVVAIKRVHPANADDANYATMLLDEARLVARIRHPNVVPTLDVVNLDSELILVMDYVHGPSLAWLRCELAQRAERIPVPIVVRIVLDVLSGLHAAHQAKSERGRPLEMVHRDVSPHNILISDDGAARLADFGIAKADGKMSLTDHGQVKGKLSYMAPEQLRGEQVDRRADVFATGIILWELLTGRDLFPVPPEGFVAAVVQQVLAANVEPPSILTGTSTALDAVVLKALRADRAERFATAEEMASALEAASSAATQKEVAAWITDVARELLDKRAKLVARVEQMSAVHDVADLLPGLAPSDRPPSDRPPSGRPAAPKARKKPAVMLLAVAVGLLGGAALLFAMVRRAPSATAPSATAPSAADAAVATPAPVPIELGAGASSASSATLPAPNVAAPPTLPSAASRPTSGVPASRRSPPAKATAPDCDPPYSIDPQGVRIPRRECLDR